MIRRVCILLLSLIALATMAGSASAQPAAPVAGQLLAYRPVNGRVSAAVGSQRWVFEARKGQRIALRMLSTSGDLTPAIELLAPDSRPLATSRLVSLGNAVIENVAIPDDGQYIVRAGRSATAPDSVGEYTLMLLPGYGYLMLDDSIDGRAPVLRFWRESAAVSEFSSSKLRMALSGPARFVYTSADGVGPLRNLHLSIAIEPESGSANWETALIVRGTRRDGNRINAIDGYQFLVNDRGQWRFMVQKDSVVTPLSDWADLPVAPPYRRLTLTIQADGDTFTLGFAVGDSAHILGAFTDRTIPEAGLFGVGLSSTADGNDVALFYDDLRVTLPADLDNPETAGTPIIPPQTLQKWQESPDAQLEELRSARVIPGVGQPPGFLTLFAFVSNNSRGGIVFVPLGQGAQFTDLVYSADLTWNASNEDVACALEFRAADPANFTIVFIDRKGGYGVRQEQSNAPPLSIYDLSKAIRVNDGQSNRLLVAAVGNHLVLYVNGQRLAVANVTRRAGGIAIAAYNYAPAQNYCQFRNIWLRSLDG